MPEAENHPNAPYLTVADPKRSIRFYTQLGFTLGNCWPDAKKPQYAKGTSPRCVSASWRLSMSWRICARSGMR